MLSTVVNRCGILAIDFTFLCLRDSWKYILTLLDVYLYRGNEVNYFFSFSLPHRASFFVFFVVFKFLQLLSFLNSLYLSRNPSRDYGNLSYLLLEIYMPLKVTISHFLSSIFSRLLSRYDFYRKPEWCDHKPREW